MPPLPSSFLTLIEGGRNEAPMSSTVTSDQVIKAARDLEKSEFTRADIAEKLSVDRGGMKSAFKDARRAGTVEKIGEDAKGNGQFRLTAQ